MSHVSYAVLHCSWLVYDAEIWLWSHDSCIWVSVRSKRLNDELCLIYTSNVSYIQVMSHIYESCVIYLSDISYIWVMSHTYESCLTYTSQVSHVWVMSPIYEAYPLHMSHVYCTCSVMRFVTSHVSYVQVTSHMHEPCLIYIIHISYMWVMSTTSRTAWHCMRSRHDSHDSSFIFLRLTLATNHVTYTWDVTQNASAFNPYVCVCHTYI